MIDHDVPYEEVEIEFDCPYCAAVITMLLDPSVARQEYIEDCEVCCRPIGICYCIGPEGLELFEARAMD